MSAMTNQMPSAPSRFDFGPQTAQIEKMLEISRHLNADQLGDLLRTTDQLSHSDWAPEWDKAVGEAFQCYGEVSQSPGHRGADEPFAASYPELKEVIRRLDGSSRREAALECLHGVILALYCRDVIGDGLFWQEHYDMLTAGWRTAIGPLHPLDGPAPDPVQSLSAVCRRAEQARFGPQGEQIESLLQQVTALTPGQAARMYLDHLTQMQLETEDVFGLTWDVAAELGRTPVLEEVFHSTHEAVTNLVALACTDAADEMDDGAPSAWTPVVTHSDMDHLNVPETLISAFFGPICAVAQGLMLRDTIGTDTFTSSHYDQLTMSWRTHVGPIHHGDGPPPGR